MPISIYDEEQEKEFYFRMKNGALEDSNFVDLTNERRPDCVSQKSNNVGIQVSLPEIFNQEPINSFQERPLNVFPPQFFNSIQRKPEPPIQGQNFLDHFLSAKNPPRDPSSTIPVRLANPEALPKKKVKRNTEEAKFLKVEEDAESFESEPIPPETPRNNPPPSRMFGYGNFRIHLKIDPNMYYNQLSNMSFNFRDPRFSSGMGQESPMRFPNFFMNPYVDSNTGMPSRFNYPFPSFTTLQGREFYTNPGSAAGNLSSNRDYQANNK